MMDSETACPEGSHRKPHTHAGTAERFSGSRTNTVHPLHEGSHVISDAAQPIGMRTIGAQDRAPQANDAVNIPETMASSSLAVGDRQPGPSEVSGMSFAEMNLGIDATEEGTDAERGTISLPLSYPRHLTS